jgi:hypothetical protein
LTNAVEGAAGPLLVHMVERVALDEDDLASLEKLINAKKRTRKKRDRRRGSPGSKS